MRMSYNMGGANHQATMKAREHKKCGVVFKPWVSPAKNQNQNNQCSERRNVDRAKCCKTSKYDLFQTCQRELAALILLEELNS